MWNPIPDRRRFTHSPAASRLRTDRSLASGHRWKHNTWHKITERWQRFLGKGVQTDDRLCEIWRHRSHRIRFTWNCDILYQFFSLQKRNSTTRTIITVIYLVYLPFFDAKNVKIPPQTSLTPRQTATGMTLPECWLNFFVTANQRLRQNGYRCNKQSFLFYFSN